MPPKNVRVTYTVTNLDGSVVTELPHHGRADLVLALVREDSGESISGVICEMRVARSPVYAKHLCFKSPGGQVSKQIAPFCNGSGKVSFSLAYEVAKHGHTDAAIAVHLKTPPGSKTKERYCPVKLAFPISQPAVQAVTDEEAGLEEVTTDPPTAPEPTIERPNGLSVAEMTAKTSGRSADTSLYTATRAVQPRVAAFLCSPDGSPPPTVPFAGLSDLMMVFVTVNGIRPPSDYYHLFVTDEDGGGLLFKDDGAKNAGTEIDLMADAYGCTAPFRLAHNGLNKSTRGMIYLTRPREPSIGITVHIAERGKIIHVEAEEAVITPLPIELNPYGGACSSPLTKIQKVEVQIVDDATIAECDLPHWAHHHPNLNDTFYVERDPDRKERSEDTSGAHILPEPPDWVMIGAFLMVTYMLGIIGLAMDWKTDRWDTMTPVEQEKLVDVAYQLAEPAIKQLVEFIVEQVDGPAEPSPALIEEPIATTPLVVVTPETTVAHATEATQTPIPPKPAEVWSPLNIQAVPLLPPEHYTVGPKPKSKH